MPVFRASARQSKASGGNRVDSTRTVSAKKATARPKFKKNKGPRLRHAASFNLKLCLSFRKPATGSSYCDEDGFHRCGEPPSCSHAATPLSCGPYCGPADSRPPASSHHCRVESFRCKCTAYRWRISSFCESPLELA